LSRGGSNHPGTAPGGPR